MNSSALPFVPTLSIVMPVYDTGRLLLESVQSVVEQALFRSTGDAYWELLIVDDDSGDGATIAALDAAARMSPSIRVLKNVRRKGVAGARNTGIDAARGTWIGFLDSDDLWYPEFLQCQHDAFIDKPDAVWRAAHFDVGDKDAHVEKRPLATRSPCLYRHVSPDYVENRVSVLRRPVDILLRCGCMQVMTVQVATSTLRSLGGFDESLPSAEDYDLWLRLANTVDLHIAPIDAGIYRVRHGSLTKAGRPMYYCEDSMLIALKSDPSFDDFGLDIAWRLSKVYATFCHHYRAHRAFGTAARYAWRLIRLAPYRLDGWRHLLAVGLRR